jgi:hypothetical protein
MTVEFRRQVVLDHATVPERQYSSKYLLDELTDADYAIEYLLNYGWLYEVEDELRITECDSNRANYARTKSIIDELLCDENGVCFAVDKIVVLSHRTMPTHRLVPRAEYVDHHQ